ncbi:hypothetical protein K505DRAFT_372737 [Melanomma pulvis-pyrius CBS 109.77]|uniref:Uncharacterized protein n=1 Tax=Melanomma pulvis-pyrius CBS 109.77 TaxID=1314802 RepID=A0A6A6XKZ9_9PLEO|nr:hypothetical protein K505DRAFT_372737 [Melanomma pulvis-pyrius CBS 109.77]
MSKGNRKRNRNHTNDSEAEAGAKRRKTAPVAASQRRGGTHRVKDEYLTHTHWDNKNYQELLYAIKARPGLYVKDMKKREIAQALVDDDKAIKIRVKKKERETERRVAELKKKRSEEEQEKERTRKRTEEKRADRERRREAGEDNVSVTSEEGSRNQVYDAGILGVLLEDEFEETESSEAPTSASISPIFPFQKLRIFEWPYPNMPSHYPPKPRWPKEHQNDDAVIIDELLPRKLPYAVMSLVTTITKEKLELPGRTYPGSVEPDFVPKISQYAIECARNGIMIGTLRKAVIERGVDWAKRTRLQGWNGRMFLHLPPRTSSIPLSDVYTKWNKPKLAVATDVRTGRIIKKRSKQEQAQKTKEKREKILDVLASSDWRPPICYLPAYLEYSERKEEPEGQLSLENLYYIRFPGMGLPHFYFWTHEGDWEDPTTPNPDWQSAKAQDEEDERQEAVRREQILDQERSGWHAHQEDGYDVYRPPPGLDDTKVRVKKSTVPRKFQPDQKQPKTSKYKIALWNIERDLYQNGLAATLYRYRVQWLAEGREQQWERLSENLPELYPSGKLPDAPPVHCHHVPPKSLAEKIASVEVPSHGRTVSPIQGNEPWTRDDDAYWKILDILEEDVSETEAPQALLRPIEPLDLGPPPGLRQPSEDLSPSFGGFDGWLKDISPSYVPEPERQLDSLMIDRLKHDQHCQVCLEPLEQGDAVAMQRHYQMLHDEADLKCPFCDMEWVMLDPQWKSSHIFSHDVEGTLHRRHRSSATLTLAASNKLYSLPSNARRASCQISTDKSTPPPYHTSRVKFASQIVEKRVAYNDRINNISVDADIDSTAMVSPKRSSMRKAAEAETKTPGKGRLRIDTISKPTRRKGNAKKSNGLGKTNIDETYNVPSASKMASGAAAKASSRKKATSPAPSAGSTPHPAKWSRLSHDIPSALYRWDSDPDSPEDLSNDDVVPFDDVPHSEVSPESIAGNRYTTPPTKRASTSRAPGVKYKSRAIKAASKSKVAKTNKTKMLATPTSASEPTVSPNWEFSEPPTPTPPRSKPRNPSGPKNNSSVPPSKTREERGKANLRTRDERSGAPTPSPSISAYKRRASEAKSQRPSKAKPRSSTPREPDSGSPVTPKSPRTPKSPSQRALSLLIHTPVSLPPIMCRKSSYDIPCSDRRLLVPPNTPATKLFSRNGMVEEEEEEAVSGGELDADVLSDMIGKVKTAKSGLLMGVLGARDLSRTERWREGAKGKVGKGMKTRTRTRTKVAAELKANAKLNEEKVAGGRVAKAKVGIPTTTRTLRSATAAKAAASKEYAKRRK